MLRTSDGRLKKRCMYLGFFLIGRKRQNNFNFVNVEIVFTPISIVLLQPLKVVASTLVDLVKNMRSFGGIVIVST